MDNMAYLQQIAGASNNAARARSKDNGFLSKIFNIWTLIGVVALTIIIVATVIIANALNKVDTKDQDYMIQSYFTANYLSTTTIPQYSSKVKNSDIRNMTATFNSILLEIVNNEESILEEIYGIDVRSIDDDDNAIAMEAAQKSEELNNTLEQAALNGILDRVFLREMTMQVAYLRSYQSEVKERTEQSVAKDFAEKTEASLGNLYDLYFNFKSNTI